MNQLLDFTGAVLSLFFRAVTAPLLLLLLAIKILMTIVSSLQQLHITLPFPNIRWSVFHLPVHWKRKLQFSRS
jgi:hypothetical protein